MLLLTLISVLWLALFYLKTLVREQRLTNKHFSRNFPHPFSITRTFLLVIHLPSSYLGPNCLFASKLHLSRIHLANSNHRIAPTAQILLLKPFNCSVVPTQYDLNT